MREPPRNQKFGFLNCPFPLRKQIVRNMEFMDAFYFSTLSKRSKRMVHDAKYSVISINFMFEKNSKNDHTEVATDDKWLKISLSDSNDHSERYPNTFDGRKLASLINEHLDDYRKKLSAHLLFIYHFKKISVHIGRKIKHLHDLFLWSARKTFHSICCERFSISGSIQSLDTDDFLKRNPQMRKLYIDDLPGKKVNDLLKQWINGQVNDLKSMDFSNPAGYPDEVIFDGIVTMETKLTEEQAESMFGVLDDGDNTVDVQRKIDGQFATILFNPDGCFVEIWHE